MVSIPCLRCAFCAIAFAVFSLNSGVLADVWFNDGGNHIVNYTIPPGESIRCEDGAVGPTTLEFTEGASVTGAGVYVYDTSRVHVAGGRLEWVLGSYDSSHCDVSGGDINTVHARENSTIDVIGGWIRWYLFATDQGEATLMGGTLDGSVEVYGDGIVNLTGGTIVDHGASDYLWAGDNGIINVHGVFNYGPGPIPDMNGQLVGVLRGGCPLNIEFQRFSATAQIIVVSTCPGDLDGDDDVDEEDFNMLVECFAGPEIPAACAPAQADLADFDDDDDVDVADFVVFQVGYGCDGSAADGPIAKWNLDGDAIDATGNGHDGVVFGAAPATDRHGNSAGAMLFDGVDDYIEVPDSDEWAFGPDEFTIVLWAAFDSTGSGSLGRPGDVLIGNNDGPYTQNKWFFALGGGVLSFHINGPGIGGVFLFQAPFTPTIDEWYHLAVTRDGDTYTLYVDGLPEASEVDTRSIPNAAAPLMIGQANEFWGGFMYGRLDEIAIYDRALSDTEVQLLSGP